MTAEDNDTDYDLQVLKNRRESLMNGIIITVFFLGGDSFTKEADE